MLRRGLQIARVGAGGEAAGLAAEAPGALEWEPACAGPPAEDLAVVALGMWWLLATFLSGAEEADPQPGDGAGTAPVPTPRPVTA